MLTDRSRPIIHRFSNFLIQTSKSKLDHTHISKSPVRYSMCQPGGVGLGIFAALDRCAPVFLPGSAKSAVVDKCTRNGDQIQMMMKQKRRGCSLFSLRDEEDLAAFPDPEFLTNCNLCRMKLSGKDVYMYRGEKAFCSEECRAVQIAKDERREECRSFGVTVVGANSCPASGRDQMYPTGIFAI